MYHKTRLLLRFLVLFSIAAAAILPAAILAPKKSASKKTSSKISSKTSSKTSSKKKTSPKKALVPKKAAAIKSSGHWRAPNYADSAAGDAIEGDDATARQAALSALGRLNGTIVVSEAGTGRILTIVNQKLAYKDGFQPCSTIKVPVALAALSETVVDRLTQIRLYGRTSMGLTEALARSSNQYFASLGEKLGFERVSYYARLFGLGEKASLNIPEEQAGILPSTTPKSGMGMMTSFGDGITLTPLEYAGLIGAVANGGTLYYLQYPRNQREAESLTPQVKRHLDIDQIIPEIKPGMMGAVEYGTARRIGFDPNEPIFGKTGTCTDTRTPTHLGWFGSFTEASMEKKIVVVVLLTGGSAVSGPSAAGVAGQVYKNLGSANYFVRQRRPEPLIAGQGAQ